MLKTKAGKDMPKKVLVVCDPDAKLEIPITLFFKPAEQEYGNSVYYFKGVGVGEYQGNKQFSMSFKSSVTPLQDYKFKSRKNIKEIDFQKGVEESASRSG